MMMDTITIIRTRHLLMAKRIHADGRTEPYGKARTIDLFERSIADLDALRQLIEELIHQPQCAAVFGGIIDPARVNGVRRLAYPDPETGDQPTLCPIQHRWVALDVDGVDRPDYIEATDLFSCGAWATQRLPEAFRGARCLVQASAGHGIKPGCRLRLWFWLDRPVTGAECERWCKGYPIDLCTFRTAQPIYTAAPVFVARHDHLPTRLVELFGAPEVRVPPTEQLKPQEKPRPPQADRVQQRRPLSEDRVQQFIERALDRVRRAQESSKHHTLRNTARLLGGIADQAGLSDVYLTGLLLDALPSTVLDWNAARDTVEWGLKIGREQPIEMDEPSNRDPRRSEVARSIFRMMRAGVAGADIIRTLDRQNAKRHEPLSADVIRQTVVWASAQSQEHRHAG